MDSLLLLGLLLRNDAVHNPSRTGSTWPTSLLFSLVQDLVPLWDATHERFDCQSHQHILSYEARIDASDPADEAAKRIGAYNAFVSRIEELGLPALVDAKPMLDVGIVSLASVESYVLMGACRAARSYRCSAPASPARGPAKCSLAWSSGDWSTPRAPRGNARHGSGRSTRPGGSVLMWALLRRSESRGTAQGALQRRPRDEFGRKSIDTQDQMIMLIYSRAVSLRSELCIQIPADMRCLMSQIVERSNKASKRSKTMTL